MAKPKRIDISNELRQPKSVEEIPSGKPATINPPVPSQKKPFIESILPSQTRQPTVTPNAAIDKLKEVARDPSVENLADEVKSPIRNLANNNVIKDKLDDAEANFQKAKSLPSQAKAPTSLPKLPKSKAKGQQEVPEQSQGRFKKVLSKLKEPRVLLIAGGLLLAAISGAAGYVIGMNNSGAANHSEDLELPPISFESFAKSASPNTNSVTSSVDLSTLPAYEFYDWPVQEVGRVSSCFGGREILGVNNFHKGLDIAVPEGTPVIASRTGIVERFRVRADAMGYGTFVLLLHGDGMRTLYAHLQPQLNLQLGQKIVQGEVFAHSGNTGHSTGPHLHFEVVSTDALAINPAQFLENRLEAPLYSSLDESCWYRDLSAFQR
jgi:murein DD-endopeptidase MepM/ murein hydrolase activator NlpD